MAKIVLISCVSKKAKTKAKAKDLYISPLFRYALKYALSIKPDKLFVLSAKYGLLSPEEEIEPYEQTLNKMKSSEIKDWADDVIKNLKKESNLKEDEIIFLAGDRYRKYLLPHISNYKIPLIGLGIGKQLKFLKEASKHE